MSQFTAFDSLLAQAWQQTASSLRNNLREETLPALSPAWVVSVLLKVRFSAKEPEIRDYLTLLDNWVGQLEVKTEVLDESSTGLLGLWIYIRRQRRKRINNHLEGLFLRSVEHNLQKPKDLSLGTSVDLLAAAAAGLKSTSSPAELRTRTSERLQALVQNADALELVQLIQSWELIQQTEDIPQMDIQHKLEAIATDENVPVIERAMAYYGQLRLADLFGNPNIEHELRFLDCLGIAVSSNLDKSGTMVKAYAFFLPYLKRKLSYRSLLDTWQRYADSSFKRAKTENYWSRYLLAVLTGLGLIVFSWPWLRQLDIEIQVLIGGEVLTAILMLTTYTLETTFELHGRPFWQKGRVEILIALIGTSITGAAAIIRAVIS